jgi:hypothetical protein
MTTHARSLLLAVLVAAFAPPARAGAPVHEPRTLPPSLAFAVAGADTAAADSSRRRPSKVYYGGALGLSAGTRTTVISVQPQIGLHLTQKASLGLRVGYEYTRDNRFDPDVTTSTWSSGLFTRYRFVKQAYAHAEFEYAGIERSGERDWIPFLWLGGAYLRPIAPRTWLVAEVLLDVLRDDDAPDYRSNEPRVSVGVVVGF